MVSFVVGDKVHLKRFTNGKGYGFVTDVTREYNGNWHWYTAYHVEYETPIPGRWPNLNAIRRRGVHTAEELELCS